MKQRKMTPVDAKTEQHFAYPTAPKKTRRFLRGVSRIGRGGRGRGPGGCIPASARDATDEAGCTATRRLAVHHKLEICCGKTTPG